MPNSLRFSLTASDGSSTLLIGTPAASNSLILTLTNITTDPVEIQQGPAQNNSAVFMLNQSAVQVYFNGMLSASVISGITLTNSPGWVLQVCHDEQAGQFLNLIPQSSQTLAPNAFVTLTLTLPQITAVTSEGYFTCRYLNMLAATNETGTQQLFINLRYPPRSAGNSGAVLPLEFAVKGSNIVYKNSYSTLNFRLTNTGADPLVPEGTAFSQNPPPQFTLHFIEGESTTTGVLLDHTAAGNISIIESQSYGNTLDIHKLNSTSPQSWTITEKSSTNGGTGCLLGTGVSANYEFTVTNIIPNAQVGLTTAVLTYTGFPGYPDGQLLAEIEIQNPPPAPVYPQLSSLSVSASRINVQNTPQTISVSFSIYNANFYQLYVQGQPQQPINSIGNNPQSYPVTIRQTSIIEVRAWDVYNNHVSDYIVVEVDTVPIGTIMMWSGSYQHLPSGWYVCDGGTYNGKTTPNLRDKFIYGANQFEENQNQSNSLNYIGGNATHTHSIDIPGQDSIHTSSVDNHSHTVACDSSTKVDDNSDSHNHHYYYGSTGVSNGAISTSSAGAHYHIVNVASQTVTSSEESSFPPYYALYFIMKCM